MLMGCKNSNTNDQTSIYADETVLIVNYQLENMTLEEHAELGSAVAPSFTSENVPGLLGKSFIGNLETEIFGGVYYFTSRSAIDDYLVSELWTGFEGDSNTNVYKKDIYMVAPISTISNGVPVL